MTAPALVAGAALGIHYPRASGMTFNEWRATRRALVAGIPGRRQRWAPRSVTTAIVFVVQ